jgi:molecular chaperone DnaK (HSP70)
VVSLLGPYIIQVKLAKEEIENLSAEVHDLGEVLKAVSRSALGLSPELDQEIGQCESLLKKIQSRLDHSSTSKTRKLVSRISSRLAWPFRSEEVKEIINQLERRKSNLSLYLGNDDR